jgi:hypothetical protein
MKKLVLLFLLAFAGTAIADDLAQQRDACLGLLDKDPKYADTVMHTIDKKLDQKTIDAHNDAFHHIQKNEAHVIYAYAAMWVIAAAFVLFLWRRQQGLRGEIAQLRAELAAAAKETK